MILDNRRGGDGGQPQYRLEGSGFCVVTGFTLEPQAVMELGYAVSRVNAAYAAMHGYAFRMYTGGFAPDRHPSWSKFLFVQDAFRFHERVFWIDSDAVVTDFGVRLEDKVAFDEDLVVQDQPGTLNMGVFALRRGEWAAWLLDLLLKAGANGWDSPREQRVVDGLHARGHLDGHVKVLPPRAINAKPWMGTGRADGTLGTS